MQTATAWSGHFTFPVTSFLPCAWSRRSPTQDSECPLVMQAEGKGVHSAIVTTALTQNAATYWPDWQERNLQVFLQLRMPDKNCIYIYILLTAIDIPNIGLIVAPSVQWAERWLRESILVRKEKRRERAERKKGKDGKGWHIYEYIQYMRHIRHTYICTAVRNGENAPAVGMKTWGNAWIQKCTCCILEIHC